MAAPKKPKTKAKTKKQPASKARIPSGLAGLTALQRKFVIAYIAGNNGTQSAIKAGYSPKTATQMASENLRKPAIREAIESYAAEKLKEFEIQSYRIVEKWHNAVNVDRREITQVRKVPCSKCYEGEDNIARLIDSACMSCNGEGVDTVWVADTAQLSEDAASLINNVRMTKFGVVVEMVDRNTAQVNLAKYHKMLSDHATPTDLADVPSDLGHFYGQSGDGDDDES